MPKKFKKKPTNIKSNNPPKPKQLNNTQPASKGGIKRLFQNKDATSIFILVFSIALALAIALYIADLMINHKDYEGYTTHFDEHLNFSVDIPSKWTVGLPDKKSLEEAVKETTGGLTFDTRYSKLSKEVTPLSLVQQDVTGKHPFKRLMVLSMFGPEEPLQYMNDKKLMEEEFKSILQELGHEGIRIERVEDAYEGQLNGVLLYAKAFFEGKKMYYVHYTESLDKNVLRVLYGSSDPVKKPKEIEEVMSTFMLQKTNILEQLMEQGISPEDLNILPPPSSEDYLINEDGTLNMDDEGTEGTKESEGTEDSSTNTPPQGGFVTPTEDGKIELNLSPKFENQGDITSSETK